MTKFNTDTNPSVKPSILFKCQVEHSTNLIRGTFKELICIMNKKHYRYPYIRTAI